MKLRKVLFLLTLPLLLELAAACCDCAETILLDYSNCSLQLDNLDNAGPDAVVSAGPSFLREAYGLRVMVTRSEQICAAPRRPVFMSSLQAYDCDCPVEQIFVPRDSIVAVRIQSAEPLSPEDFPDEDVTGRFRVFEGRDYVPVADFLIARRNELVSLEDDQERFDLFLIEPPASGLTTRFTVTVELSDGRTLSSSTAEIELQ